MYNYYQARDLGVELSLQFKIPSFECLVKVDKHKLSQVIRNLISNALKFCQKPGMIKVEVDVVPTTMYSDLESSSLKSKLVRRVWRTNRLKRRKVSCGLDNFDYYLRLSVTDDGTGISKVILI